MTPRRWAQAITVLVLAFIIALLVSAGLHDRRTGGGGGGGPDLSGPGGGVEDTRNG